MRLVCFLFFCIICYSSVFVADVDGQDWKKYRFEQVGVSFEGPAELHWSESTYDGPKIFMQLYPIKRPAHIISDTFYRVKITIKRTRFASLEQGKDSYLRSDLYKNSTLEEHGLWFWAYKLHEKLSCRDDGQYSYCRKDIMLEHGYMISAEAEILNSWQSAAEKKQAEQDIRTILSTIKTM